MAAWFCATDRWPDISTGQVNVAVMECPSMWRTVQMHSRPSADTDESHENDSPCRSRWGLMVRVISSSGA